MTTSAASCTSDLPRTLARSHRGDSFAAGAARRPLTFRNRPLDAGPYTFVWIDALTQKVREGGRTVNVHCLIATGVNADGYRELLGIDVTSSEDGAG